MYIFPKISVLNKKSKLKKPYWNDTLDGAWNAYAAADKQASHAYGRSKQKLRADTWQRSAKSKTATLVMNAIGTLTITIRIPKGILQVYW